MLMTQPVILHCHKKLNHVLCDDGKLSSKVQRLDWMFFCCSFVFQCLLKLTYKKELQSQGWPDCMKMERAKWPHLAGGWLGFHRLLQAATTTVYLGCQHIPQAQSLWKSASRSDTLFIREGKINNCGLHFKSGR